MKKKELIEALNNTVEFMTHKEWCSAMQIKHDYVSGKLYKTRLSTGKECNCGYKNIKAEINDILKDF